MLYLVQLNASLQRGHDIDKAGGPGPIFAHIGDRFRPQGFYFNPTRREAYLIVELENATRITELMYILTEASGNEPKFTPLVPMSEAQKVIPEALQHAAKAPKVG